MKTLANTETNKSVSEYIASIPVKKRKADAKVLLEVMKEITGKEPKIWGVGIVAFGKYKYKRKNGDEFEWFNVGFTAGRARLAVYVMYDISKEIELKSLLGKHTNGKGCLYIKKLSDVNMDVHKKMIAKSDRWQRN